MSFYMILTIVIGVVWLSTGVALSIVMGRRGHRRRAVAELARQARLCGIPGAGQELLCGPPAEALSEFARAGGYQLLVVGGRGRGLSKAVLGSTASALAASCSVPTMIVSGGEEVESAAA